MMARKRVAGIAVAGALALCIASAAAGEKVGVMRRVEGPVTIERDGLKVPATTGGELHKGDRIVTDKDAYAEVQLRGLSPLRVGPNASIAVDRLAVDEKTATNKPIPVFLQGLASLVAGATRY